MQYLSNSRGKRSFLSNAMRRFFKPASHGRDRWHARYTSSVQDTIAV